MSSVVIGTSESGSTSAICWRCAQLRALVPGTFQCAECGAVVNQPGEGATSATIGTTVTLKSLSSPQTS